MQSQNKWTVYQHINKINGKKYFGITSKKPQQRWKNGYGYTTYNSAIGNAIKKYGWQNFDHIIIAQNIDQKTAKQIEKDLIRQCRKTNKDICYNITDGGDGACGMHQSQQSIQKTTNGRLEWMKNNQQLQQNRKNKISQTFKSNSSRLNQAQKATKAFKDKCSKMTKDQRRMLVYQANQISKKKVLNIQTNTIYSSMTQAANDIHRNPASLCQAIKRNGLCAGYHWKYI